MRDIKRIDKILNRIGELWKNYPDLRLGQIIVNSINVSKKDLDQSLFYIEDEQLFDKIEEFMGLTNALLDKQNEGET